MSLRRTLTMLTAAALSLGVLSGSPAQALEATPPPAATVSTVTPPASAGLATPPSGEVAVIDVGALLDEAARQRASTQSASGVTDWVKKSYKFSKTKRFYARAKIQRTSDNLYLGYRIEAFTQKKVDGKWVRSRFCKGQHIDLKYSVRRKAGAPHPGDWRDRSAIGARANTWQITDTVDQYFSARTHTIGLHAYYWTGSVCRYPFNVDHGLSFSGYEFP